MPNNALMNPACPRCGYDLSGLVASWTDECPLRERCSECGQEFESARVMRPERYQVRWLFEHAPDKSFGLGRAWMTWRRLWRPSRFWARDGGVRLDTQVVPRRLASWLPMMLVSTWLIGGVLRGVFTIIWYYTTQRGALVRPTLTRQDWAMELINPFLLPVGEIDLTRSPIFEGDVLLPYPVKAWLAACMLMPLLLLALSRTRAMAKVKRSHVIRAGVYGCGLLVVWPVNLYLSALLSTDPGSLLVLHPVTWSHERFGLVVQACAAVLGLIWFAAYWRVVLVRVFALPSGRGVFVGLLAACLLAAMVAAALDNRFATLVFP